MGFMCPFGPVVAAVGSRVRTWYDAPGTFFVDSDHSSTRVRSIGEASVDDNLAVGSNMEVQFESNSTSVGVLIMSLAGCARGTPFENHEIPEGPGLVSGEDGKFKIYGE